MESITVEDVKKALLRQLARGYALHGRPAAAKAAVTGRPVRPLYPSKVIPL
jgi:hypothetical protein